MTKGSIRGCYRDLLRFSFLSIFMLALAFGQENTGRILGTVTDESGAVITDAQIVATSPSSPKALETMSDTNGNYTLFNVPLGVYTVSVSKAGFATVRQQNVNVTLGAQVNYNPKMSVGQVTQVVEVTDSVVSLDTTSSRVSTNISSSQFEGLAKGRNFNSILALAPGVRNEVKSGSQGVGGIQVDGSSGGENAFLVDGVDTSDVRRGSLRQQFALPFEMIQEVQVKSGGYEAEYGGATGGVVSVATKGGSNEFHGEGWFQLTNDALNAGDRGFWQRSPRNANVADFFRPKEDQYHIYYPGGRFTGPLLRNQLFFSAIYSPELEHTDRTIDYTQDSLNKDKGVLNQHQDIIRHYGLARLDFQPVQKLQVTSSYFWSPLKQTGVLQNRDIRVAPPSNDLSIQGGFVPAQTFSAGATYTATPHLIFSGRYGYRYLNDKLGNYGISGSPYLQYNTSAIGLPGVPSDVAKGTGYTNVSSTLLTRYDITTRHNAYLDATYIAGKHTIKGGYYLARLHNSVSTDYSNGRFGIYWGDKFSRGNFTNVTGQYGYYIWEDGVTNKGDVNSRNQGLYIQDGWRVSSRVTLNLGIRFENEFLPPYQSQVGGVKVANPISFDWGSKIAPRIGGAWDIKGDGRWKLSGSYGIFYDVLKYELARGSFGSDHWISNVYKLDNPNVLGLSLANPGALGTLITKYDNRTIPINSKGEIDGVDHNIKPYKSQEFSAQLEHSFASRLVGGVRYTHKDLLRAIEDIGVLDSEGNEVYLIGNPGFGDTRDPKSPYGGKTPNGQNWLVPKATRTYDALEFRIQGQARSFGFIGSYTWSRLYGNYSGAANSDESGRQDPGVSRAFDLPYYYFDATGSQKTREGLLGTDRPHTFKFYGNYDHKWGRIGNTNLGVNQIAYSGTPDSTTVIYGSAPTFPYGRGDLGRTPFLTQTDLLLAHTFTFTEHVKARFEFNVINLFNQATVISRVTQLNRAGAIDESSLPPDATGFFKGYDPKKFVAPGNPPGTVAPYNPIYMLPGGSYRAGGTNLGAGYSSATSVSLPNFGAYQDFRTIRLGFRLLF